MKIKGTKKISTKKTTGAKNKGTGGVKLSKKKIILIVALLLVVVIALAVVIGISIKNKEIEEQNKAIKGIAISTVPKLEYYVGDEFDPTGLQIQVVTEHSYYSKFISYPHADITVSGFDSSVAVEKQPITVKYKEYTATFYVTIKEPPVAKPRLQAIEVYDFITTYTLSDWNTYGPNVRGGKITCIYSDGSVEGGVYLKASYIYGWKPLDAPGTTEITVKYSDGITSVETTVTITVTE